MASKNQLNPLDLIKPRRAIQGITAVLLPFTDSSEIDWEAFDDLLRRTIEVGLIPAVNMDTGYVNLLSEQSRSEVLRRTRMTIGSKKFVAGAYVADNPGDAFNIDAYLQSCEEIQELDATPVIFQSYGLAHQSDATIIDNYQRLARHCDRFIAFELGTMFAPFGNIYSLDIYRELLNIPQCVGAKHSSLRRDLEWQRLALRDEVRPGFHVYTGNDLAIDMVIYGSDYLLGLSSFAPDAFARRDALWQAGDPAWNQLNDLLQYLGQVAFRQPVPAYKHAAAMFLQTRGWIRSAATHPDSPQRGSADRELLEQIAQALDEELATLVSSIEN